MKKRYRDLTEKYKSFRLQPDSLYCSRNIQTLLNKYTKQGKKELARKHFLQALFRVRYLTRKPRIFNLLTRILSRLRLQFLLVPKRKGKKILNVPVPVRRNKRDVLNIHTLYSSITKRNERAFSERVEQELLSLVSGSSSSPTLKQQNAYLALVYEERVNFDLRWK